MAKQRFGINDGYRGTVGTVVGYQWKGKWCLRARPRWMHNPRTAAQQANRALFKAAVQFGASLKTALRKGLHNRAEEAHMTECNYFYHLNNGCFALEEGRLAVDFGRLAVSDGPVAPVGFAQPEVRADGGVLLTVPFEKNPLHLRANSDDEVRLLAVCQETGDMRLSLPVYRRSKSVSIALPEEWEGREVHLYGFVTDYDGRASASTYLGMLADGLADGVEGEGREELAFKDVAPNDAVMRVVGGLEGGAVAHDELDVGGDHALRAPQDGGDELRE